MLLRADGRVLKMDFQVRQAHPSDLAVVCRIETLSFKDPYPPSFLASLYAIHSSTFLVAEIPGDSIVGYSVTAVRYGMLGHLLSVATDPKHRKKGIATALVTETSRLLRGAGASVLRLECRVSNSEAIRLYEKLGFERGETEQDYYPDGEAALVMYKRI